jgi:hypothetical protein
MGNYKLTSLIASLQVRCREQCGLCPIEPLLSRENDLPIDRILRFGPQNFDLYDDSVVGGIQTDGEL